MFKKDDFVVNEAVKTLETLEGRFAYPESGDKDEVNDILEKVLFALKVHGDAPKYVLTRALYAGDDNKLTSARFVVKPSTKDALEIDDCKKTIELLAGKDFFNNFIKEMAVWFDTYNYYSRLQSNVEELNEVIEEVIAENEIAFGIKFSLGEGLIDASDNYAIVGLSEEVIETLGGLALFDENLEARKEGYKAQIADAIKQCAKPYDIVKVKSLVTKDLGVYSRKSINKLMRNFVSRKLEFTRVGTGYKDTETYFALVEKKAVSEVELEVMDTTNALVIDNEKASTQEKKVGATKVVVSYKVSPFNKETGEPVEVKLEDII